MLAWELRAQLERHWEISGKDEDIFREVDGEVRHRTLQVMSAGAGTRRLRNLLLRRPWQRRRSTNWPTISSHPSGWGAELRGR